MTNQKKLNLESVVNGTQRIILDHGGKTNLCSVFETSYNTVRMALLGITHTDLARKIREYAVINLNGIAK